MKWWMWDLIVLAIVAFSVWRGWRKGLVLSVAGVVIFIVSIWLAGVLAGKLANPAADKFADLLGFRASDAYEEVISDYNDSHTTPLDEASEPSVTEVAKKALQQLGVGDKEADKLVGEIWNIMTQETKTLKVALMTVATRMLMRVILFVFFFILLSIVLHIIVRLLHTIFELPIIKQVDKFAGLGLGLITALLILFAAAWAIRYSGMNTEALQIDRTILLKLFININPLRIF